MQMIVVEGVKNGIGWGVWTIGCLGLAAFGVCSGRGRGGSVAGHGGLTLQPQQQGGMM